MSALGGNNKIPAPSRNWSCQFRRAHVLKRQLKENSGKGYGGDKETRHIALSAEETNNQPPLSDYYFQVDIQLRDKRGHEIDVVSRIVDNAEYKSATDLSSWRICLPMENLEELAHHEFDGIKTEIVVYQRSTGKQAFLYNSGSTCLSRAREPNWFYFDDFRMNHETNHMGHSCSLFAHKTGCPGLSNTFFWTLDEERKFSNFFSKPHLCELWPASIQCTCPKKWSCFWQMDFQLSFLEIAETKIAETRKDLGRLLDLFNNLDYV